MITINLNDPNAVENFKAIEQLRESGMFTDAEIQKLYEEQVERDKKGIPERGQHLNTEKIYKDAAAFFKCKSCHATVSFDNDECNTTPSKAMEYFNKRVSDTEEKDECLKKNN